MARYRILVTRTTTESCVVEVEASNRPRAEKQALVELPEVDRVWELDDPGSQGEPFVSGWERIRG